MKIDEQMAPMMDLVKQGVGQFADALGQRTSSEHPYVKAAIGSYLALLQAGGKRARGILTVCGYQMHGGSDPKMIATAAGIVEAMHAYLLVVDDVADNASTRRGMPTAHIHMQNFLDEHAAKGDGQQAAADMAISASLAAQHLAQEMFSELDVLNGNKIRAAAAMNKHLARTNIGQVLDMASTTGVTMTEADITSISRSKTAYYTFQMPLEIGALLSGALESSLKPLADYSLHAGLAFQLQDDIMGVFGDELTMGKSPKSDIAEGKQTLLINYAVQAASKSQKQILQNALGNSQLSDEQFAKCQAIIKQTGALKRLQDYAQQESKLACKVLDNPHPDWSTDKIDYLKNLAQFVVNRSK